MFAIVVIIVCTITLFLLKIFLNVNFKNIKGLNDRVLEELEKLSNKFSNDEQICKDILKILNNEKVKVKVELEYSSCLYTIFNNTITIGKFKQNYMTPQTIAHECIHSCQNKKTLWANFIISNIYLIYFITISILQIFNLLSFTNIHILILIFLSLIRYILRFGLENEAMIKAPYLAKQYIEEKELLETNEKEKLLKEYEEINNIAIPFVNYITINSNLIKIILFCILVLI